MAERRQKMRGTTTEHASYSGAVGQITVDTDKKTAVVQDGSQNGGFPLASETLPNRVPTRGIMAGAYAIGNYTVSAQRSAYVGTNGREFVLRDNGNLWHGATAGGSALISGSSHSTHSTFGDTAGTLVSVAGGATLQSKMAWNEWMPNAAIAGGLRQSAGCMLALGDGSMGGFHLRYVVSFPHTNTADATSNFFVGMKKLSSFINNDMKSTAPDHLGIGTSSTAVLTTPRLLVLSGGGGLTANNTATDTGIDIAQNDVVEIELLSLPFENSVVHWKITKLNDPSQTATGTVTGSGNNMPATTDLLYLYMHRYHPSENGTWRLNSVWWRNFAESCGVL